MKRSVQWQATWYRRAQAGLIALLFFVGMVTYLTGYRPQANRRSILAGQIADARQQLADANQAAAPLDNLMREVDSMQTQFASSKALPSKGDVGPFMRQITELSRQSNLANLEVNFPAAAQRGAQFSELPVTIKFQGNFTNVYDFLRRAEQLQRLTRVGAISIHGVDLTSGIVTVDMSMSLFFAQG